MCWYSVEHSEQELSRAEAGQRLTIRKIHAGHSWVVNEGDLKTSRPAPVCLLDGTRALFRPTLTEQTVLNVGAEPEALFRMTGKIKRDVFEFQDGRQIAVDELPEGLIFDVLLVPGSEHLTDVLNAPREQTDEQQPVLTRLYAFARSVSW